MFGTRIALLVAGLSLAACSSATPRTGFGEPAPAPSTPDNGGGNSSGGFGDPEAPPTNGDGCSEEAKLVYVLSLEGDIYSFAPAAKKFTKIGPLDCSSGSKQYIPISMAVDRNAVAWVNMREPNAVTSEGTLFKVDTKTAACTPTGIRGSMGGMGFSTNEGTTDKETLFVVGEGSNPRIAALQKVDTGAERLVRLSDFHEAVDLELTGTGDGRLYGFLISSPLALAAVDKSSSAFSGRVSLAKVQTPRAPMFAFSFWGGDFYFYTATDPSPSKTTTVSRYRPSDKSVDSSYMDSIGFHIVGAGVSTCAPTAPPK